MSIDLSEFRQPSKPKLCRVGKILTKLDETDVEKFQAALEATDITNEAITNWLVIKTGDRPHVTTLALHRRSVCTCDRP